MPKKDEHIDWAKHDRDFWTSIDLDNSPYTDWAATGMFYESLHWVEAFLATKGYHSGDHRNGERAMLSLYPSDLAAITADFNDLKKDSETARYDCYKHTAEEARQLIPLIDNIKNHISQLI
jgi:uncharacterized protein (UPF0332 family)